MPRRHVARRHLLVDVAGVVHQHAVAGQVEALPGHVSPVLGGEHIADLPIPGGVGDRRGCGVICHARLLVVNCRAKGLPINVDGGRRLIRGVFHAGHANAAANGIEVWNDLDIGHHAAVFVVEDVAVDDELADVTVVVRAHQHLVIVLHEEGVLELVPHPAVLVLQAQFVGRNQALAIGTFGFLAGFGVEHVHHLERVDVNVKDMRFALRAQHPVVGGVDLASEVDAVGVIGLVVDEKAERACPWISRLFRRGGRR
ncbi:hypothetical protein D3C84_223770 [compost metagenome]